jgi:hypothetical protein
MQDEWKWVGGVLWQCNFENPGQSAATTRQGQGKAVCSCPARAGSAKERHAAPCSAAVSGSGLLIRYLLRPYAWGWTLSYFRVVESRMRSLARFLLRPPSLHGPDDRLASRADAPSGNLHAADCSLFAVPDGPWILESKRMTCSRNPGLVLVRNMYGYCGTVGTGRSDGNVERASAKANFSLWFLASPPCARQLPASCQNSEQLELGGALDAAATADAAANLQSSPRNR